MAIPFAVPSHQQVSPERLRELYDFLQQLLLVCQQQHQVAAAAPRADARMLSALSALERGRRQRAKREGPPEDRTAQEAESQNQRWKRVGSELRKIADEFESAACEEVDGVDEVDASPRCGPRSAAPKRAKRKISKILSMPVMIGSVCTAVLCVGWQLLRNR